MEIFFFVQSLTTKVAKMPKIPLRCLTVIYLHVTFQRVTDSIIKKFDIMVFH
jgi:hypothetical protein